MYVHISTYHAILSLLFCVLQAELEPISIYHPTTEEVSTAMGTPMEGFFDGADVVAGALAFATAQGVPAKTPIPFVEHGPIEKGAQTERVSELVSILAETPTP